MRILVTSDDVLTVLPRLLDHIRRLGVAAQAIIAEPKTSSIRIMLDRRALDRSAVEKLQARFSQVAGVKSVTIPFLAARGAAHRRHPAAETNAPEIGR